MNLTPPKNILRTMVCAVVLSIFASAQAASLLLDFGPTTISGTDGTNSPAHSLGFVPAAETSWNKITVDNSSLVYSDGSTATGVAVVLGRSDAGVSDTVNFNNKNINSTGLTGSGTGFNSGVYAGTSPMKDGIFATGTSAIATNALGLRVDGLPAGEYTVYVAARNSNSGSSHDRADLSDQRRECHELQFYELTLGFSGECIFGRSDADICAGRQLQQA
jgi:hypothetical protein